MTSNAISDSLRKLVTERAKSKCEYCRIHQDVSIYSHEVDHIIASKHGGQTKPENFALACLPCNRHLEMLQGSPHYNDERQGIYGELRSP